MGKRKAVRGQIILECTTCRESGKRGVSRYISIKNSRNTPDRLELKKYCRYERAHTIHREVKK